MSSRPSLLVLAIALAATPAVPARTVAETSQPPLQAAAITEHVGDRLPLDTTFTDSEGRRATLREFFGGKPAILSLAYFTCPMLCHLGQDGVADALRSSGWTLGSAFTAVTVSIDPHDTPALAAEWRARAARHLAADRIDPAGWHFVVGDQGAIDAVANAVGFAYARDPATGQFSHAAAVFVITPDGRIARYLYGIGFEPTEMAAALAQAKANRVGGPVERFLLRCYHYVPALRHHGGFVAWLLRIGGLLVVSALGTGLVLLWRQDGRRHALHEEPR